MLNKIKSYNILRIITKNLDQKNNLKIAKYNHNLQKRLGLSIQNYKEYFTQIEIELIPKKIINEKETFINLDPNNITYHIYFNDKQSQEINRQYITKEDQVTKIKVIINSVKNKSLSGLFKGCHCLEKIKFTRFNINDIKDMSEMFSECSSLKSVIFEKFDTNQVTNMFDMFCGCDSLSRLDLAKFETSNVTNMRSMFSWCKKIKKLELANFNMDKIKDLTDMFYECSSLKYLNLDKFVVNKRINALSMLSGCNDLEEFDISGLNKNNLMLEQYLEKMGVNLDMVKYEKGKDVIKIIIKSKILGDD